MSPQKAFDTQSGKAGTIILVALAVIAVGGIGYFVSQNMSGKPGATQEVVSSSSPAAGETAAAESDATDVQDTQQAAAEINPADIKPGNPVVAKVNGQDVTRVDVFNFIQQLPPASRQDPLRVFPLAQEQVINARLIENKTKGVDLGSDPEVQKQLDLAKKQIIRNVYLDREVEKRITDERLQDVYKQYLQAFPDIQEVKASHILVAYESKAKELIGKLKDGADFGELARENSSDATAQNGGDLGYFAKEDNLLPEFTEAAFKLKPGEYTTKPVKTEFGYHIIKVSDMRKRPPADFETVKPFLEGQLRRLALDEVIQDWKKNADIKRFDINGEAIEPAAGSDE